MPEITYLRPLRSILGCCLLLGLGGCILTDSDFRSAGQVQLGGPRAVRSGTITVNEGAEVARPYILLGTVTASARSFNLLSSNPTRADIDEELRAKAAAIGANAVIGVKYYTERQGLASRGLLTAEGQAIAWR